MQQTTSQKILGFLGILFFAGSLFMIYKAPIAGVIALIAVFSLKNKKVARQMISFGGFILFVLVISGLVGEMVVVAEKVYSLYFGIWAIFINQGGIANFFSFFRLASFPQIFGYFIIQSLAIAIIIFFLLQAVYFAFTFGQVKHKKARVDAKPKFDKLANLFWDKACKFVLLGVRIDYGKGNSPIGIPHGNLNKHTMLVGTTGSGKTVTLYNFIANALLHKKPVIFIDGKGDLSNIKKFEELCQNENYESIRPVVITIDGDMGYNPFAKGTPTELTDKIISMFDWSEEHYKLSSSRFVLLLMRYMQLEKIDINLPNIVKYANLEDLKNYHATRGKVPQASTNDDTKQGSDRSDSGGLLLGRRPAAPSANDLAEKGQTHDEAWELLQSMVKIDLKAIQGLQSRLAPLAEGDSRKMFMNKHSVNLDDIIASGGRILFSLDSLRYPEQARGLGRLIVNDLKTCVSAHQRRGGGAVGVFIDEFNVFASHEIVDVINKSRSAGFEAVLAFQSLADIDRLDKGVELRRQIVQNCNTLIVQLQNDAKDAEELAALFGTRKTIERTLQTQGGMASGMGSEKVVDEYNVNPNEIRFLNIGEAWVKTSGEVLKIKVANFL